MIKYFIFLIVLLSCLWSPYKAITKTLVDEPVKIGEIVPDVSLGEILNFHKKNAKISDFKGKVLILDFWTIYCGTCIEAFPKIALLQEKFKDKVVILPVGFEGELSRDNEIKNFFLRRKGTTKELKIPTAVQTKKDSILRSLFPFQGVPLVVWIDSDGRFLGSELGRSLTEDNIRKALRKEELPFGKIIKRSSVYGLDRFLIDGKYSISKPIYGSVFSEFVDTLRMYNPVISSLFEIDSLNLHFVGSNLTVLQYYTAAYSNIIKELVSSQGKKRIIIKHGAIPFYLDWSDARSADNWSYKNFQRNNLFCYELILPKKQFSKNDAFNFLREDFDRFFGIASKVERRRMKHLSLVKVGELDKLITRKISSGAIEIIGEHKILLNNYMMSSVVNFVSKNSKTDLIIIDKTGVIENVDILLPSTLVSVEEMKGCLQKYGLDLIYDEGELDMLILEDIRKK